MWLTRPHRGFFERKKRGKKMKKENWIYLPILYSVNFKQKSVELLNKYEANKIKHKIFV